MYNFSRHTTVLYIPVNKYVLIWLRHSIVKQIPYYISGFDWSVSNTKSDISHHGQVPKFHNLSEPLVQPLDRDRPARSDLGASPGLPRPQQQQPDPSTYSGVQKHQSILLPWRVRFVMIQYVFKSRGSRSNSI